MNKLKTLYILSMIFLAISVIGGGMAISGFFFKNVTLQFVGVIILLTCYIISFVLDIFYKKEKKDRQ